MKRHLVRTLAVSLCVSAVASAATQVLTVGGGPFASSNQLSLEKNVIYFREVLSRLHAGGLPHDVLFADAGAGSHTVQYTVPVTDDIKFVERLAMAFGPPNAFDATMNQHYRRMDLPGVKGESTGKSLGDWFDGHKSSLKAGDRLLFYYTGHGSGDADKAVPPRNTTMDLWHSPALTMTQFVKELDKLGPNVETMLVMVQCHSGGFANVIYVDGDPAKGLSPAVRYGYFSTVAPRIAAGCTSDIQGDDYQEFSTAFFAALCGRTRGGRTVEMPDYDHDGHTTMDEAFASVLLTSDTIDVPMTTSDQLLRDFSRFANEPVGGPARARRAGPSTTRPATTQTEDAARGLLGRFSSFAKVLPHATPAERAAMLGLAKELGLSEDEPVAAARAMVRDIERENVEKGQAGQALQTTANEARQALRMAVLKAFPELTMLFSPAASDLMANHLPEVRKAVEAMPEFDAFVKARDAVAVLLKENDARERRWVKTQRLIERFTTVALAANLDKVAANDVVERFKLLREKEGGLLQ